MKDIPVLVLGSKNYSSWSLRPWLFLRKAGMDFRERIIHFDAADYREQIAALSPSGRVPLLIEGKLEIWDSLAICEFAAERLGRGHPAYDAARAVARSVAAEMHSGFQALRDECPMNVRAKGRQVPRTSQLLRDIARIDEIWSDCRSRFGAAGSWLFGDFSIADAMFAPVVYRFRTYGANLGPAAATYLQHVLADPDMLEWREAAEREGHPLAKVDEIGTGNHAAT
jgi:glutathione S-transferase